jgi:hypothetical protein
VHGLDNKRRGRVAHLQARVLDGFATTRQRRRRGINGGGGKLGFRAAAQDSGVAARARVTNSRGGGRLK